MAMRLNPVTGLMEDDGTGLAPSGAVSDPPVNPVPVPDVTTVAPPPVMAGSGGASPPPAAVPAPAPKPTAPVSTTTVQVGTPKPAWETSRSSTRSGVIESAESKAAAKELQGVRDEEQVAIANQGINDQAEATSKLAAANDKLALQQAESERKRREDAKRAEDTEKWLAGEKELVKSEMAARSKTHNAEADFFEGRPAAKVFSNILQAIGEVAAGIATPNDPNRPSRVTATIKGLIDNHRNTLLSKWEASKEARALHKENRAAWEKARDMEEVRAANQAEAQLGLLETRLAAEIARLGPDRAKAANEILRTEKQKADAQLDLERKAKYDKHYSNTVNRTDRDPNAGSGATTKADDTQVFDSITGALRGTATTPIQAKQANENENMLGKATLMVRRLNEINEQLPKLRIPGLQQEYMALEKEKTGIMNNLTPMGSQMSGSGVPTGREWEAFVADLDRGLLQGQKSFSKQNEQQLKKLESWRASNWNSVGVNRDNPKVDTGKSGLATPSEGSAPAGKPQPTIEQLTRAHTNALASGDKAAAERYRKRIEDLRKAN